VFRRSDFVSVSCPLTPETRHLVNADRLALMKPTAYLINTARGPIVDQRALTKALEESRIAGAGLDVLEKEPPDADDPILKLDNVIFAPHALCWTDQCFAGNGAADVSSRLSGSSVACRRSSPSMNRFIPPSDRNHYIKSSCFLAPRLSCVTGSVTGVVFTTSRSMHHSLPTL
jgi:D-isomer specific 2-hydroxyacid dehydrogenase, NAD binding domain